MHFFYKFTNLTFRQNLSYNLSLNELCDNNFHEYKLITNYSDIDSILKNNDTQILKFLYNNESKIHEILLESDNNISLNNLNIGNNLENYFYLNLLIRINFEIINYLYSFELILKLNSLIKYDNNNLKNILLSKIILDIINNYKNSNEYNENTEEQKLNKIEKNNNKLIEDNINIFNELNVDLNLKNIMTKNIDIIYIEIIIELIKSKKIDNFEYSYNIIYQLDLENIGITKYMLKELYNLLNLESNIKEYIILELEDLFDSKKINFYFILLKYILKNSFYIYQLPFLLKTRKTILNIIKCDSNKFLSSLNLKKNDIIKEKIIDIVIIFMDSKYYEKKYLDDAKSEKNTNNIKNTSKDNIIKIIPSDSLNINLSKKENTNIIQESVYFQSQSLTKNEGYSENKEKKENDDNNEKSENNDNNEKSENNDNNENRENDLNNEDNENRNNNEILDLDINDLITKEVEKDLLEILKKSSKFKILEFAKIIGTQKLPLFIKKLNNNYYISGGEDNILLLYNYRYEQEMKIELKKNKIPNIICDLSNEENEIKFVVCCKKEFFIIDIINKNNEIERCNKDFDMTYHSIFHTKENDYIILGNKGIFKITDLLNNKFIDKVNQNYKIYNKSYIGGIRINKNIMAFTSNSILQNGEDSLLFYNIRKNKIFQSVEGYSFLLSLNGLCYMSSEKETKKYKVLLCACKKYKSEQKNGILLLDYMELEKNRKADNFFYNTDNFVVYCFCPILIINNDNSIKEDITIKKNITIINTDYFFVGGFDEDQGQGMIKLFKIVYNKENNDIKIKFIQDIIIETINEFKGFEKPINCMIQSDIIGNILITCGDGNIYLFKPPNIDYLLKYDNN